MKKIITAIVFFALTLGAANTVLAQSFDAKVAQEASKQLVKSNIEELHLSTEQQKAMYNASMLKLRMTASARNNEAKKEINETFNNKLKAILKPKQYKAYLKTNK